MPRAQGSLEYLLILAAILAIAVVVVLVANSMLAPVQSGAGIQESKYACASTGIELIGFDKAYHGVVGDGGPTGIKLLGVVASEQTLVPNNGLVAPGSFDCPAGYPQQCAIKGSDGKSYKVCANKDAGVLEAYLEIGHSFSPFTTSKDVVSTLQLRETIMPEVVDTTRLTQSQTEALSTALRAAVLANGVINENKIDTSTYVTATTSGGSYSSSAIAQVLATANQQIQMTSALNSATQAAITGDVNSASLQTAIDSTITFPSAPTTDSDADGVFDSRDYCPGTSTLFRADSAGCPERMCVYYDPNDGCQDKGGYYTR